VTIVSSCPFTVKLLGPTDSTVQAAVGGVPRPNEPPPKPMETLGPTFSPVCSKQFPRLFTGECLSLTARPSAGSGLTGSAIIRRVSERSCGSTDVTRRAHQPREERCRFQ
jgi:hypothetical protein